MKADLRAELVLVNRNVDEMIRLLQCATDAGIWTRPEATRHEARLALLRAKLNTDFAELDLCERALRAASLLGQRSAAEPDNPFTDQVTTQIKHTQQHKRCFFCI
jgi:hypothetical protein